MSHLSEVTDAYADTRGIAAGVGVRGLGAGCFAGAKRNRGSSEGYDRSDPARRDGRSRQPGAHRKVRTAVTDDRGAYQIVDLRPGTYTVTFTLTGFATVKREDIELPGNFTATVNADMRVGALEETVTVSGASPVVDVQSTTKAQVINREMLDAIPTGTHRAVLGQLVPGVTMRSPMSAVRTRQNQVAMNPHGNAGEETTVMLDGIQLNGMCGNGATQAYSNTQSYEEIVFQTSGAGADVSARRRPAVHDAAPGRQRVPRIGGGAVRSAATGRPIP